MHRVEATTHFSGCGFPELLLFLKQFHSPEENKFSPAAQK
jgi:hypothetical protein